MMGLEPEELQEAAKEGARGKTEPVLEVRVENHALRALGPQLPLALRQARSNLRLPGNRLVVRR